MKFPPPACVRLGGLLGKALDANHRGRLANFIRDETSPPVALFCPDCVRRNQDGDWYGEHAGKWLVAAARAANRTGDPALTGQLLRVADYLAGVQEPDGYLGTYAPERRFMCRVAPGKRTWDGAPGVRTWDIWVHSYLILGLLEVNTWFPNAKYLGAARKIGDLIWRTLSDKGINITELGNHFGLSATVLLDPAVELFRATGEARYLELARLVLTQANQRPGLELLDAALAGVDAAEISTGKAYQLSWNFVGLAKLYRETGDETYLRAVRNLWTSIRTHHLTLGGGPWGGVAHRSREVFNPAGVFSPYGYVETCSILSWIQLNRELLSLTGEAKYAEEIEKSAYNDLLGAQDPNGEDWCYYSFPNGKRVNTTYWRCCKSSGAMALEELPAVAYGLVAENTIAVNLYGPGRATIITPQAGTVNLEQITSYPFDGTIRLTIQPERAANFAVRVRIPSWADKATITVNGAAVTGAITPGSYFTLERTWRGKDEIVLQFPMTPVMRTRTNRNVQESKAPDGSPVSQEVLHYDYAAITRGPLVYATGLIDGFKVEETIRLSVEGRDLRLEVIEVPAGYEGPAIRLNLGYRTPLIFQPYYEAGGRKDGAWRLTWMQTTPV
jgi:DUF1680 family protein